MEDFLKKLAVRDFEAIFLKVNKRYTVASHHLLLRYFETLFQKMQCPTIFEIFINIVIGKL